jgi:hypothetical protein
MVGGSATADPAAIDAAIAAHAIKAAFLISSLPRHLGIDRLRRSHGRPVAYGYVVSAPRHDIKFGKFGFP